MIRKRHVMVDIETLDTRPGAAILSIGAVEFDELGAKENTFEVKINLFDSLMNGFTISTDTVDWWRAQGKKAQAVLTEEGLYFPVEQALTKFADWLPPKNDEFYLWAKGPDFDIVLLDWAYRKMNWARLPWSYRNVRDVRTMLWSTDTIQPEARVEHDAVADAIAQAQGVAIAMQRAENGQNARLQT